MNSFANDFSFNFYKEIILIAKSIGSITNMADYEKKLDNEGVIFIWRHDIDVSLEHALIMAKIEKSLDISSTYMVIPDYSLYNLNNKNNRKIILQIEDMGHEIGLHFDVNSITSNTKNVQNINNAISKDLDKLNQITSSEVKSISFHRPIKSFLNGEKYICDCLNAYSKELMEFYISDSKGRWREGNPLHSIVSERFRVGQILTHPFWWSETNISPIEKLNRLLIEKKKALSKSEYNNYKKNIDTNLPGVTQNSLILNEL